MTGSAPLLPPPFAKLAGRWWANLQYFGLRTIWSAENTSGGMCGPVPIFAVSCRQPLECECGRGHGGGWGRPCLWQGSPAPPC